MKQFSQHIIFVTGGRRSWPAQVVGSGYRVNVDVDLG